MSGSPKYSSVTVSDEALEAARREQARARLARERAQVRDDVTTALAEIEAATSEEFSRYLNEAAVDIAKRELAEIAAAVAGAEASGIVAHRRTLRRLRDRWTAMVDAAHGKFVALALDEERARDEAAFHIRRRELARLRETVGSAERRAIDEAGDKVVRTAIADADRMLREGTVAGAMKALARAERAERGWQRRFAEIRRTRERVGALQAELDTWRQSAEAARSCRRELGEIQRAIDALGSSRVRAPDVDDVRDRLAAIPELVAERRLKDREREVIVAAARAAFEDLGFLTSERAPNDQTADWVIDARHEQGSLTLEIPTTGELRYVPSEALLRVDSQTGESSGCDSVVDLLDRWREGMANRNVNVGRVQWNEPANREDARRGASDARQPSHRLHGRTLR